MVLVSFITALVAELSGAALGFGPAILYASWAATPQVDGKNLKSCSWNGRNSKNMDDNYGIIHDFCWMLIGESNSSAIKKLDRNW